MKLSTTIFAFVVLFCLLSFSDQPDPMAQLAKEYCGCSTRLGRIMPDTEEVMGGCMRIFTLGNPTFIAAEKAAFDAREGDDFSLRAADWSIVEQTIARTCDSCAFASKRVEAGQVSDLTQKLVQRRKELELDRHEESIAQTVFDMIMEERWDEITIYHEAPPRYEAQKEALAQSWTTLEYDPEVFTYTSNKEFTEDQLIYTYEFYVNGRSGMMHKIQIHFQKDAAFEKVQEIWMGN